MNKKSIVTTIVIALIMVIGAIYVTRSTLNDWWMEAQKEPIPEAYSFTDVSTNTVEARDLAPLLGNENTPLENEKNPELKKEPTTEPILIPESINLDIPFTSQAPHANWDLPYQEACEEASMLMAVRFLQDRTIADANDADQAILQLVDFGTGELGLPIDTTVKETTQIVEQFYDVETEIIEDFTWDDVKTALAQGYPVLAPVAGQQLGNPNFTSPGPIYHMLVIKGYTPTIIITNDPGTRNGADYQYSYDTLYSAIHDWNDGNVPDGAKRIIIVKPKYH